MEDPVISTNQNQSLANPKLLYLVTMTERVGKIKSYQKEKDKPINHVRKSKTNQLNISDRVEQTNQSYQKEKEKPINYTRKRIGQTNLTYLKEKDKPINHIRKSRTNQ